MLWSDSTIPKISFVSCPADETGRNIPDEVLFTATSLAPFTPLKVTMLPIGDTHCFGVIVTDDAGQEDLYLINISGRDGSLTLIKAEL